MCISFSKIFVLLCPVWLTRHIMHMSHALVININQSILHCAISITITITEESLPITITLVLKLSFTITLYQAIFTIIITITYYPSLICIQQRVTVIICQHFWTTGTRISIELPTDQYLKLYQVHIKDGLFLKLVVINLRQFLQLMIAISSL